MTTKNVISIKNRAGEVFPIRVDPDDYDMLIEMGPWHMSSEGYACHSNGNRTVLMHRVVMGLEGGDGKIVDHKNRNRTDNRRSNLRVVSASENQRNRSKHKVGGSKFIGVSRTKSGFMARMRDLDGEQYYIGHYRHAVDAAEAYDRERIRLGLSPVNFPPEIYAQPSLFTAEEYRKFILEARAKDIAFKQTKKESKE